VVVASANLIVTVTEKSGTLIYAITNEDDHPVTFLTAGTPFEGTGIAFFPVFTIIAADGSSVPYVGPLARRVVPAPPEAYVTIHPFSTLSVPVSVHEHYQIRHKGIFEVNVQIPAFNPTLETAIIGEPILVELAPALPSELELPNSRANSYTNCDATEKSQIDPAKTTAQNQALRGKNCMAANSCNSLSSKWFGATSTVNTGYYSYDESTLTNVYNRLASYGINAYCNPAGCGPNVYAYVYPNDRTYTVYLCGAFWSQANERANTIVHEMSHFDTLGGTQDYAYGQPACLSLAKSNPYQASHNADNVCYFSAEA
jgi:peptidyl-Lys metalloendopeptidase